MNVDKLKTQLIKKYPELINKIDTFDFNSEYDTTLTYQENYKQILEKLKQLGLIEKFKENKIRDIDKIYQEQEQLWKQKMLEEELKELREIQEKRYSEIIAKQNTEIQKYYLELEHNINMLLNYNEHYGLIILGKAGIGKSFNTAITLKKMGFNFYIQTGNITSLSLFHLLYAYRKEKDVLIFDDTQALLKNKETLSLLNSALWCVEGTRILMWKSTTKKLMCPQTFEYRGKIIILANQLPKNEPIFSRTLTYNLDFSREELIELMYEIAKQEHKKLTKDERIFIVNWIKDNTDEATSNFDLRLQRKIELIYTYCKDNNILNEFEKLAKKQIETDELRIKALQLIKSNKPIKELNKEWTEETGLSYKEFQRIRREMGLTRHYKI